MNCNPNTIRRHEPLEAVRREFERNLGLRSDSTFAQLSVTELNDGVSVSFDLPGMTTEDITVMVENGELSVSGERKQVVPDEARTVFSNQTFGEFRRVLKLHESIDPASVDAVLKDGVLTVKLSKRPELQPRKITIRDAGK